MRSVTGAARIYFSLAIAIYFVVGILLNSKEPPITMPTNTRVLDRNRRHEVPGTVVESNSLTALVEWDDSAGIPDLVFIDDLEVFNPKGSAR